MECQPTGTQKCLAVKAPIKKRCDGGNVVELCYGYIYGNVSWGWDVEPKLCFTVENPTGWILQ